MAHPFVGVSLNTIFFELEISDNTYVVKSQIFTYVLYSISAVPG